MNGQCALPIRAIWKLRVVMTPLLLNQTFSHFTPLSHHTFPHCLNGWLPWITRSEVVLLIPCLTPARSPFFNCKLLVISFLELFIIYRYLIYLETLVNLHHPPTHTHPPQSCYQKVLIYLVPHCQPQSMAYKRISVNNEFSKLWSI